MKLLLILFTIPVHASAATVVCHVDDGNGAFRQYETEVGPGGGCSPAVNITQIWDTSKDGPLPEGAPIGYAERYYEEVEKKIVPRLRENTAMKLAKLARDAQKAQDVSDKAAAKAACDAAKAKIKAKSRAAADLSEALNCLLDKPGE